MTILQACKTFNVGKLDESKLNGQEEAFQTCLAFLKGVKKIKAQNKRSDSYWLKHLVENPSGKYGIPSSQDCYASYIYEGTVILAALASGFVIKQYSSLNATFNIGERSLRERAKEVCEERKK